MSEMPLNRLAESRAVTSFNSARGNRRRGRPGAGPWPHLLRGLELYRGRLIAYSLGNFCTYGRFSLIGPLGHAVVLSVELDPQSVRFSKESSKRLFRRPGGAKPDPLQHASVRFRSFPRPTFDFPFRRSKTTAVSNPHRDGAGLITMTGAAARGRVRELMLELAKNGIPDSILRRAFSDKRAELVEDVHEKFENG